jgi:putative membrane protein
MDSMNLAETLPATLATLNGVSATLLVTAYVAIRRGLRERHRALMIANLVVSCGFMVIYLTEMSLFGSTRFPGDDWVRTLFLTILISHTILAVLLVPLVFRTFYLAFKERFPEHRRIARITFPVWLYISVTGVVIYWMTHHLRPHG